MVRGSECDTNSAGVDVDASHGCKVMAGDFACGFRECNIMTSFCEHDEGTFPDRFTCKPLPTTCPSQFPTCACLANAMCGTNCSGTGTTGLTVTCVPAGGGG